MWRRRRAPEPSASARARAAAPPTVQVRTEANLWEAEEAGVEPTEDAYAPSNGFEARAPHRERYSSAYYNAALRPAMEERSPPPLGLPLQFQLDHCQDVGGAVPPAQRRQRLRIERLRGVVDRLAQRRRQLVEHRHQFAQQGVAIAHPRVTQSGAAPC